MIVSVGVDVTVMLGATTVDRRCVAFLLLR